MSDILSAAVICDNYKVDLFKKDILDAGYKIEKTVLCEGDLKGSTIIKVDYTQDQFAHLTKLIKGMNFRHSKVNKN